MKCVAQWCEFSKSFVVSSGTFFVEDYSLFLILHGRENNYVVSILQVLESVLTGMSFSLTLNGQKVSIYPPRRTKWGESFRISPWGYLESSLISCRSSCYPETFLISTTMEMSTKKNYPTDLIIKINMSIR